MEPSCFEVREGFGPGLCLASRPSLLPHLPLPWLLKGDKLPSWEAGSPSQAVWGPTSFSPI